jgi:hypothetical protein
MKYHQLSDVHAAVEIYNSYFKVAAETGEKDLPFERLLFAYGFKALDNFRYKEEVKSIFNKMNKLDFENIYNESCKDKINSWQKEEEKTGQKNTVFIQGTMKDCFEKWFDESKKNQIINSLEYDMLISALNDCIPKTESEMILEEKLRLYRDSNRA